MYSRSALPGKKITTEEFLRLSSEVSFANCGQIGSRYTAVVVNPVNGEKTDYWVDDFDIQLLNLIVIAQISLKNSFMAGILWYELIQTKNTDRLFSSVPFDYLINHCNPDFLHYHVMNSANIPPNFLDKYGTYLQAQLSNIPAALTTLATFHSATSFSYFHTEGKIDSANVHYSVEGYWAGVDKSLFDYALNCKMRSPGPGAWMPEKLAAIRTKILDKKSGINGKALTEDNRYPIPEEKPWPNQDKFIACLEALESLAMRPEVISRNKNILFKKSVPKEILQGLLPFNISEHRFRGCAYLRLPLAKEKIGGNGEYIVRFPDEKGVPTLLAWTDMFKNYVKEYNIVPSKPFLEKFDMLLKTMPSYARFATQLQSMRLTETAAYYELEEKLKRVNQRILQHKDILIHEIVELTYKKKISKKAKSYICGVLAELERINFNDNSELNRFLDKFIRPATWLLKNENAVYHLGDFRILKSDIYTVINEYSSGLARFTALVTQVFIAGQSDLITPAREIINTLQARVHHQLKENDCLLAPFAKIELCNPPTFPRPR